MPSFVAFCRNRCFRVFKKVRPKKIYNLNVQNKNVKKCTLGTEGPPLRKEINCEILRRRAQLVSEELVDGLLEDKHPEPLSWFANPFH